MRGGPRARERLVGCFLLGLVLLDPPLLGLFGGLRLGGWPVIYLYLFGAWVLVIALVALLAEGGADPGERGPEEP